MELNKVTSADFAPWRGTKYRLGDGTKTVLELELAEVTEYAGGRQGKRQPFSLIFRGPLSPWVPQMTYRLEHDSMGEIEMFLVPLGPDEVGMRYQAIFN